MNNQNFRFDSFAGSLHELNYNEHPQSSRARVQITCYTFPGEALFSEEVEL